MSPYMFSMTSTWKRDGSFTSCMQVLSTIISSGSMSGYSRETRRKHSRNRPSEIFMMFALWTAVTLSRAVVLSRTRRRTG